MRTNVETTNYKEAVQMENVAAIQTKIEFKCGCGFNTMRRDEAIKHVADTGHTLSVHGSIKPER